MAWTGVLVWILYMEYFVPPVPRELAAILLELERATGRGVAAPPRRQGDGAAPLIGSSEAIRRVRDRIERVAATDFTVLIEGASMSEKNPRRKGIARSGCWD